MTNTGSDCAAPACDDANASASTPAATGRLPLFRPVVTAASAALALDAHHGKNQDGCHAFIGSAMHGDPEAPGRRFRREFEDGPHFTSHCRNVAIRARYDKDQDMVNGILIRPERIRAGLLFGPPLQWRIAVNASASSQFVFLNALLKQVRLRSHQNW